MRTQLKGNAASHRQGQLTAAVPRNARSLMRFMHCSNAEVLCMDNTSTSCCGVGIGSQRAPVHQGRGKLGRAVACCSIVFTGTDLFLPRSSKHALGGLQCWVNLHFGFFNLPWCWVASILGSRGFLAAAVPAKCSTELLKHFPVTSLCAELERIRSFMFCHAAQHVNTTRGRA